MDLDHQIVPVPTETLESGVLFEFASPRVPARKSSNLSLTVSPWQTGKKREVFEEPPTDLVAITRAIHADGYVRTAVSKYVNSIFLRGYKIVTKKPVIDEYLQLRLHVLMDGMGRSFNDFFQNIARDLVVYANVYILKVRAPQKKLPKGMKITGVPILNPKTGKQTAQDPIASYELIHPASMHIVRDRSGNVVRYEQWPWGERNRPQDPKKRREFKPVDVIHVAIDREDGHAQGITYLAAVLDDVRLLRTIEDHASRLTFRFAFPFTQMKVGTDKPNQGGTEEDLAYWRDKIKDAPPDATMVTDERVEFNVVGAQGQAIELAPYLAHFQQRSFSGLQVSDVTMGIGDTANRATADALNVEMHDQIKHFQNILHDAISNDIFRELLHEGGFDFYEDPKRNWARLVFDEIEVESMIKLHSHYLAELQAGVITFSEYRELTHRDRYTEKDWDDTYLYQWLVPQDLAKQFGTPDSEEALRMAQERHKHQMDSLKADIEVKKGQKGVQAAQADAQRATAGASTDTHSKTVSTGGGKRVVKVVRQTKKPGPMPTAKTTKKATDHRNRPANQHGRRLGPKRSTEALHPSTVDRKSGTSRYLRELQALYGDLKAAAQEQAEHYVELVNSGYEEPSTQIMTMLFALVRERLEHLSEHYLVSSFTTGVTDLEHVVFPDQVLQPWLHTFERKALMEYNESTMGRLTADLSRSISRLLRLKELREDADLLKERIEGVFAVLSYRLGFIADSELPQAYWFGYASAAQHYQVSLRVVAREECCENCRTRGFKNPASAAHRLALVPPNHPNCDCALEVVAPANSSPSEGGSEEIPEA